jgi:FG-GAP repeat
MTFNRCRWCNVLAVLCVLASTCVSAATNLTRFPEKPADVDQARWTALQYAVTAALPTPANTELTDSDGVPEDHFGLSIALSGTTALIGAIGSNDGKGAVYAFTFNGSTWVQQQELTASDGAVTDDFGWSVALSGTTALVGAPHFDGDSAPGAAYVFTFNGSLWVQQQKLTPSDAATDAYFGLAVALSGTTALVGEPYHTAGLNSLQGAAYVFTLNGDTWVQQKELTASDGAAYDAFGQSVALSGNTALIGAYGHTVGSNNAQGAAYVFTRNGTTWSQQPELTTSDGATEDLFGWSVALSDTTALIGAYGKTFGSNGAQGAAYVFTLNGSTWDQQQELTASDGAADDYFGYSVALSGTTALIGATSFMFDFESRQGAAYVFTFSGSTWGHQQKLTASDGAAGDDFGAAVALSGTTALVGAPYKTIGSNTDQGAVYVCYLVLDRIFYNGFDVGTCV